MRYTALTTPEGEDFVQAITKLRDEAEVGEFLTDMFTPDEARTFVSRWKAALMLHKGIPYVEIQKETGLSSATVARVSQALKYGTGGLKKILERLSGRR